MRLRTRILLAQAPLIVALLFVVWSAWRLARVPAGPTLEARADRLETATLGAAAIAFGLGAVASVRLTNAILRPLSILGQAARRLAEGDLEARVVLSGAGELRDLAQDKCQSIAGGIASAFSHNEESHYLRNAAGLLAGVGLGVGLGMLFAPASGKQTRSRLSAKDEDFAGEVLERGKSELFAAGHSAD